MNAPTGTVTIVFTDIEDSTPLWERHGRAFEACLARHNELMRAALALHDGFEVKTEGDAFMVAFARAGDAVGFALAAQLALHAEPWPADIGKLMVRMGMHTGEPILGKDASGRMDYFGPVVNRAARVSAAGHGGQILLSESARNAAQDALGDALLTEMGEHALKGLERPERLYQILPPQLSDRSFAPLQTVTAMQTNLPPQSTSFIGRRREIEALQALLAPRKGEHSAQTKLLRHHEADAASRTPGVISLVGPGGTGKTRLALRVGSEVLDRYEGGVWFVDLSACREAGEAATEVANALGVRLGGNDSPVEAVGNVLQYRKPLLLILDNFEQLAAHSAELVGEWRRKAPQVTFVVTTRAVLGLRGEREFELQPMGAPKEGESDPGALLGYESVALFVQRAKEADERFVLDEKNAADVARICADLEGIPLAVELAASRVKLMKPAQILKRLEKKFELLKSTRRDTGLRQRTLYDALEWSFDLLTEWERAAFMQACAFKGGFLLEAAEAVIDLSEFPDAPGVLDALQSLREKSLLRTEEGEFETRFAMYKPIHDFGENRLGKSGDLQPLYARHCAHFVAYTQHWSARVYSPDELEALNRLEHERANAVAAQERALKAGDTHAAAKLALAMSEFFIVRGPADLRARVINSALEALRDAPAELASPLWVARSRSDYEVSALDSSMQSARRAVELATELDPVLRCQAHRQLAHANYMQARWDEAEKEAQLAVELANQSGDKFTISQVTGTMGIIAYGQINYPRSLQYFEEAEKLMREVGYPTGIANHTSNRALVLGRLERREEALDVYQIATDIYTQLGNRTGIGRIRANSGAQFQMLGRFEEAKQAYLDAVAIQRETGHKHGMATALGNLGQLHTLRLNDTEAAARYLTEALALSREINSAPLMLDHLGQWGYLYRAQDKPAQAAECWGEAVKIERAIGAKWDLVKDLLHFGAATFDAGRHEEGAAAIDEALALAREIGNQNGIGRAQSIRGQHLFVLGRLPEAEAMLATAAGSLAAGTSSARFELVICLWFQAQVRLKQGRREEALELARKLLALEPTVPRPDVGRREHEAVKFARDLLAD